MGAVQGVVILRPVITVFCIHNRENFAHHMSPHSSAKEPAAEFEMLFQDFL